MGAPAHVSAPRRAAMLLTVVIATACGSGNGVGSHSPSRASSSPSAQSTASPSAGASPSSAPQPVAGAYGVLVSSQAASTYTVSIVGTDGTVVASAQAGTPPLPSCANSGSAMVPLPVSTSNSGVYYEEAQGGVTFLAVDGSKRQSSSVPAATTSRRSMFAVSPDDQRIAVVVDDYNSSGASTTLYVQNLDGAGRVDIFSETGARTLWPIGWHGTNNLVLAVVPACAQPGPLSGALLELHVVDPATATRRFTLGNSGCPIMGAASPAGAICWDGTNSKVLNWTAAVVRTYPVQGPELQLLSPTGSHVALIDNVGTMIEDTGKSIPNLFACTWVDDSHLLSGGDPQHQPRITDVSTGSQIPVPTQGDCGGRIPGGL